MKKRGLIKRGPKGSGPRHPVTDEECNYYVEYQEEGKHVDSATFASREECERWLSLLYNVEAT